MTKGLEALKYMCKSCEIGSSLNCLNCTYRTNNKYCCNYIEVEKELKVLEIIKEHFNFDKDDIFEMDYKGKHYYMFCGRTIKKETYDILKEVLENE